MQKKGIATMVALIGATLVSLLTSSCDSPYLHVSPSKMEFGNEGGQKYIKVEANITGWKAEIVEGASWINMKYIPNYGRDTIEAGTPLVIPDKRMYSTTYKIIEYTPEDYSPLIITVVENNNPNERRGLIAITSDNPNKFPEYKYAVTIIQQGKHTEPED